MTRRAVLSGVDPRAAGQLGQGLCGNRAASRALIIAAAYYWVAVARRCRCAAAAWRLSRTKKHVCAAGAQWLARHIWQEWPLARRDQGQHVLRHRSRQNADRCRKGCATATQDALVDNAIANLPCCPAVGQGQVLLLLPACPECLNAMFIWLRHAQHNTNLRNLSGMRIMSRSGGTQRRRARRQKRPVR